MKYTSEEIIIGKMKVSTRPRIYVAGPYTALTHSQIDDNIRKAERASIRLIQLGWNVYTPHKNTAHYEIYDEVANLDYHLWVEIHLTWLLLCHAIFILKNHNDSKGTLIEIQFAKKYNIPVYYQSDAYPTPDLIKQT